MHRQPADQDRCHSQRASLETQGFALLLKTRRICLWIGLWIKAFFLMPSIISPHPEERRETPRLEGRRMPMQRKDAPRPKSPEVA
jgi:hypothetical protein